jgi:glycosyltransferase involved in cell wall biosynthesis
MFARSVVSEDRFLKSNGPTIHLKGGGTHSATRPSVRGKFIFVGQHKFYVRGVTYGTFRPDCEGHEFPSPDVVKRDFTLMAANGLNAVRTYTAPPRWLLDLAQRFGLRVMIGLGGERLAAFLDYGKCVREAEGKVREQVTACAGHPAVLCFCVANEIPASLVRWHGHRQVERFIERLYRAVKKADPQSLVTYANYPSTEYLQLPFLDLLCFNVYLESQPKLDAYLARLHNQAVDRPLIMGELGLDSLRNGERTQARGLEWQLRTSFAAGCAGAFVYAWTDEWFRGGEEVEDWKFGITDRQRKPKRALARVREVMTQAPFVPSDRWPRISVAVCTHNGARTIRDCCEGLERLEYPNYEVIVVDDGSTDTTASIVREYGFRLISTTNQGLSNARNTALLAATGEVIAYIDDDAYPDPQWLTYLVSTFLNPISANCAGVGGPNIAPSGDGLIADCVAHAPGGPVHVLLTHRQAEHIPGCNMAFRVSSLKSIGGFDPQFRVAGDDVDVCWRLQQAGWSLGFSPSAVVWHHRRNSVKTYWRQQSGYGKAEAMLERKWPEKYNAAGHATWHGRIYGNGQKYIAWRQGRIYHGTWGLAPYQGLQEPTPNLFESLPMMPEWWLVLAGLGAIGIMGALWRPLSWAWLAFALAAGLALVQAIRCGTGNSFADIAPTRLGRWQRRALTSFLYLVQPLARLCGRLRHGLTVWRRHPLSGYCFPSPWTADIWAQGFQNVEARLQAIEVEQRVMGVVAVRGSPFDRWDLEVSGGMCGATRLSLGAENHSSGRQLLRVRCWPRCSFLAGAFSVCFGTLAFAAAVDGAVGTCALLGSVASALILRTVQECAFGNTAFLKAIRKIERIEEAQEEGGSAEAKGACMQHHAA